MHRIVLLSASVRKGRNSHRVTRFFNNFITENKLGEVEILDLDAYQFPLFEERLSKTENPSAEMLEFADKITSADGIIMITPEYNGGYPASLKNVIDLLYAEWKRKPIALAAVSDGQYGGSQVLTSLSFSLLKIGATVVPSMYRVANVTSVYDEEGKSSDPKIAKFAGSFIRELLWYVEAKKKMN